MDDIMFVIHWMTCYNGVSERIGSNCLNLLEVFHDVDAH